MFEYDQRGNKIRSKENYQTGPVAPVGGNNSPSTDKGKSHHPWIWYVVGGVGVALIILMIVMLSRKKKSAEQRFGFRFY